MGLFRDLKVMAKEAFGQPLTVEDHDEIWADAPMRVGFSSDSVSLGKIFKAQQTANGRWNISIYSAESTGNGFGYLYDGTAQKDVSTKEMLKFLTEQDNKDCPDNPTHISQIAKLAC